MKRTTEQQRRRRGDSGVTMVVIALTITAVVLVAALAIDGGRAYANRRQMQNAADIAAIAGSRYLATHRYTNVPSTAADLVTVIRARVQENGGDTTASQLDCWLVGSGTTPQQLPVNGPIDVCDIPSTQWSVVATGAVGVEVRAARDQKSFLASVGGIDSLNARAYATATMQKLVGTGDAPFIVCGAAAPVGYGILDTATNQILPGAVGQWYPLQAGQTGGKDPALRNCSAGDAFDGTGPTENDQYTVPTLNAWLSGGNGNPFDADTLTQLTGGGTCTAAASGHDGAQGCKVVLPIANQGVGNGSKKVNLFIVAFGVFEVWGNGTGNTPAQCKVFGNPDPKFCGKLLGAAEVSTGTGGSGDVGQYDPYLVRLVPNPKT